MNVSTITNSVNTSITNSITTHKIIKHGDWSFEYRNNKNTFETSSNLFDDKTFKIYDVKANDTGRLIEKDLEDFRKASVIHRIARQKARSLLYDGSQIATLVDTVENLILDLTKQDSTKYYLKGGDAGIAFPVGVNVNNIIAHDSKTIGIKEERTLNKGDVVKIDIGVHINGRIIDSAFTHIISDKPGVNDQDNIYNSVLEASRDSVFSAIAMSGPDQSLYDLSEYISEIISSYEVDTGLDPLPIKPVTGIGGHNIQQYKIHGGKLILSVPDKDLQADLKMEDGEIYAIETYASTGFGTMTQYDDIYKCTHFMQVDPSEISPTNANKKDIKHFRNTELYDWLGTRKGLPFSSSWLDEKLLGKKLSKLHPTMKKSIETGQLIVYPPLLDEANSVVAQFEHTIHIKDGGVEIFSLGLDY